MPIIVESSPTNAEMFLSVVGSRSRLVANLDELKRTLAESPDEYAIVLGPTVDLEASAALAETLRVTRPTVSVILIRRRVDTSVLAEALRSGMREVVDERDLTGLGAAVDRAMQVWQALTGSTQAPSGPARGKVVTVFSPKGGVGKTTLAVNLALALSENGSRRVCLVDLDLAFGDVAITLQLFPARTIADAVHLQSGLDFPVLEPLLTDYQGLLSALVAPVQPDAKDSIPPSLVGKVLSLLKQNADFVVVDTSPALDEYVLQAFDETDEMLLVATLDVPTLKNVKVAVETLDLLNFPKPKRHLVLNRADDKVGLSADKVESTLGMKIALSVPTSSQVAHATNAGEPIVTAAPRHPVSQAVTRFAATLSGVSAVVDPPSDPRAGASAPKRSLLRRNLR
ncbi:MAG: AAA family ATPase [Nocardioidaceae bacterium]